MTPFLALGRLWNGLLLLKPSGSQLPLGISSASKRSFYLAVAAVISLLALSVITFNHKTSFRARLYYWQANPKARQTVLERSAYVQGPPGKSFRDALRPEMKYVTTWNYAGMTNDFMTYCNMIYLAVISRRVPIVPPLLPGNAHISNTGLVSSFGEFFDLPGLSRAIETPILEWADVKIAGYGEEYATSWGGHPKAKDDALGCWSIWSSTTPDEVAAWGGLPDFLRLRLIYTPIPKSMKLVTYPHDPHFSIPSLASVLTPAGRLRALRSEEASKVQVDDGIPANSTAAFPDEQLACFDLMYFGSVRDKSDWDIGGSSPVWDLVGTNVKFTDKVQSLANFYLRGLFGLEEGQAIPPVSSSSASLKRLRLAEQLRNEKKFISVHVRRNDFAYMCQGRHPKDCFAPLSDYARRVDEIREELTLYDNEPGYQNVTRVVVTSDEKSHAWWAEVEAMGWLHPNHQLSETETKYGEWYLTMIDTAIQSMGAGFVGTHGSTMSDVASRRVRDWNDGPSRFVKWGKPGADNH